MYSCDGVHIFCADDVKKGTSGCSCQINGDQYLNSAGVCKHCNKGLNGIDSCENGQIKTCLPDFYLDKNRTECPTCPGDAWCADNTLYCYMNVLNHTEVAPGLFCHCHETNQYLDASNKCMPCQGKCEKGKHLVCWNIYQYLDEAKNCQTCPSTSICDGVNNFCKDDTKDSTAGCRC